MQRPAPLGRFLCFRCWPIFTDRSRKALSFGARSCAIRDPRGPLGPALERSYAASRPPSLRLSDALDQRLDKVNSFCSSRTQAHGWWSRKPRQSCLSSAEQRVAVGLGGEGSWALADRVDLVVKVGYLQVRKLNFDIAGRRPSPGRASPWHR